MNHILRRTLIVGFGLAVLGCAGGADQAETPPSTPTIEAPGPDAALTPAKPSFVVPPTKGPLQHGFSVALNAREVPDGYSHAVHPSIVIGENDDPRVAWIESEGKKELVFSAWDSAEGRWRKPVKVDDVTEIYEFAPQVSLARDASNKTLVIAYRKAEGEAWMARSTDDGITWKTEAFHTGAATGAAAAAANGTVWVATADRGVVKLSTYVAANPPTTADVPLLPDAEEVKGGAFALATDSAGHLAALYATSPKSAYNSEIGFWRPGDAAATKVSDSNNVQNDDAYVSLAFAGDRPRAAYALARGPDEPTVHFAASDDGKTWSVTTVPEDGGQHSSHYLHLTSTDAGDTIVAPVTGGNGTQTCGEPKLSRSVDHKVFTTCSPDDKAAVGLQAAYAASAVDSKGRLYLAFENNGGEGVPHGLVVWSE